MAATPSTTRTPRILIATGDTLGARMAGPAMRAWHIAHEVSAVAEVHLVSTARCDLSEAPFPVFAVNDEQLRAEVEWADAVVFQGHLIHHNPWIADTDTVIVADIYDPMHLETLEQGRYLPEDQRMNFTLQTAEVLNVQIERADFLLCASEKQRDFWLGQLAALGRINPVTYDADASLRSLLAVAPFGVTNEEPEPTRHAIKGAVPGIGAEDKVILWGGGIYNWFDPITLVHAVDDLRKRHDNVRLFFMGMNHPNPDVPVMEMATRTRELAAELGLTDTHVFFNNEWVDYNDRVNYLCDADVGVTTHFEHVETAFSFRTRMLDYLWAGLPIVATGGDTFDSIITTNGLGITVPPEDVNALSAALETALFAEERESMAQASKALAREMTWLNALRPLVEFCAAPHRAPDLVAGLSTPRSEYVRSLETRIAGLEQSASWRLTAPLRKLTGLRHR
ncbi:glycosyltransferase [Mycetocola saprophilus]|uniref:glycosyltransferase n=1 Tax=Mycetocola saprophilus TaxID=76636 RepID=UPI0005BC2BC7|nr:glycosyltransferase [Mycetocola saprophilus]